MNQEPSTEQQLDIPESLQRKLDDFRSFVRVSKSIEAAALVASIGLLCLLSVYGIDRLGGAPASLRWLLFVTILVIGFGMLSMVLRWIWNTRQWEQSARLLRRRDPGIGDELLSALELSHSAKEQNRSRALCHAAIQQVAQRAEHRNFRAAAPKHFAVLLGSLATVALIAAIALSCIYPTAFRNALARLVAPWKSIDRYTFTSIVPLPDLVVVPHGEPTSIATKLDDRSVRKPDSGRARLGSSLFLEANLLHGQYQFELPSQVANVPLRIDVGDYHQTIEVVPKTRPELTSLAANVKLPAYLQRSGSGGVDVRSGVLSAVQGSSITLGATASRALDQVWIADQSIVPQGARFSSDSMVIADRDFIVPLHWRDVDGLTGKSPFLLEVRPFADQPPSATIQGLPHQSVVLESEQLNFEILAADDFGIKRVGLAWRGLADPLIARPAEGQRVLASGSPEQTSLQPLATFCASALDIPAQPLEVRAWVEDYMPNRPQVFSATYVLYVMTADQHAIWITGQINKWQGAALDVRDAELQLFENNRRLRADASSETDNPELFNALRRQASLEEANARRLNALTQAGTELLQQAARNRDIDAGNVDQLAQMLTVLNDIGQNRMPSVADLLSMSASHAQSRQDASAKAAEAANQSATDKARQVGQNRAVSQGGDADGGTAAPDDGESKRPQAPSLVDVESTMQPLEPSERESPQEPGKTNKNQETGGRFGLPQTTLIGPENSKQNGDKNSVEDVGEPLAKAIDEQSDLLNEFDKVAEQLGAILAGLEGSTLVKRLKAASREQGQIAQTIASRLETIFGRADAAPEDDQATLSTLADAQVQCSQSLSFIMSDMQAYYDRRKYNEVKSVLNDMKASDVLLALRKLSDDLPEEHGLSIAQAEYWAEVIDRWAEDLIPPTESPTQEDDSQPSGPSESLPPSVVLEMLRILEGEVNLREETRVVEQASKAAAIEEHERDAKRLGATQAELRDRTHSLTAKIRNLPDAEKQFAKEMDLLVAASYSMEEARIMLDLGDTGPPAIAAETEVIELLLQSQRINPDGGSGGGGSSPGGGGTGKAHESALALLGAGLNQNEHREHRDVGQAIGKSNQRVLPEEFRDGLDTYFRLIEKQ